jgi:hypothetical protein
MRARRLTLTALAAATLLLAVTAPAARADDGGGAFIDDGDPTAVADDTGEEPGSSGGGGDDNCTVRVAIEDDFSFGVYDVDGSRVYSETGRWLERVCDGFAQEPFPEGGAVDPRALALSARESVSIAAPPITTSPSADDRLYTQVQTWLWLDEQWWTSYSATATAGRVSATVTATPTTARWDTGDGGGTTCRGPGVPWRRGMPDSATYCKQTYRHSSAGSDGGTYTLAATVTFEITWSSNTGAGGTLEAIERTASRDVEVGEIQAVETE